MCVRETVKESVRECEKVCESVCESVKRYFCAVTCHNYLFCKRRDIFVTFSNAQKFSLLFPFMLNIIPTEY